MAKYIKCEAVLEMIRPDDPNDERCAVTVATAKRLIRHVLAVAPAANVAPVTRCKDCANSYEGAFGRVCAYSIFVDCTVPDDFYCASSKPKEGVE